MRGISIGVLQLQFENRKKRFDSEYLGNSDRWWIACRINEKLKAPLRKLNMFRLLGKSNFLTCIQANLNLELINLNYKS